MRRSLVIAGLVVFLIVDVVLVVVAWQHTYAGPDEQPVRSGEALDSAEPRADGPRSDATGSVDEDPTTEPDGAKVDGLVAALADGLLVRAPVTGCRNSRAVTVEVSTDCGSTFVPSEVAGLTSVLDVDVADDSSATLVGTDDACRAVALETADAGESWTNEGEPDGVWSRMPDDVAQVRSPAGPVDVPCRPRALSPVDDGVARVLCPDGEIFGTSSAGAEWVTLGRLPGAVTLSYVTASTAYALSEAEDCQSAVLVTFDGGSTWDRLHCAGDRPPRMLTTDRSTVIVMAGETVSVSTDEGATWSRQ